MAPPVNGSAARSAADPGGPVLVVNAGSATLALSVVADDGTRLASHTIEPWDGRDPAPVRDFLAGAPTVDAVGHRVVHGGDLDRPALIDDEVVGAIRAAGALSPVHQKRALAGIEATTAALPQLPHVACFDTTFHRTLPDRAAVYALPAEWRRRWPLRRRGFHGLSHGYVAAAAPRVLTGERAGRPMTRIVSCHLGSGASLCAIEQGRSVDTTMGATPLEGLVMARRSGSVDPGVLLWLLDEGGLGVDEVRQGLSSGGGLAGLSGGAAGSGDMRDVLAGRAAGDPDAALAFDVYVHRLQAGIAAMAAALGGLDLLAFTGGVGEHLPEVRTATLAGLGFLGLETVPEGPEPTSGHRDLSTPWAAAGCVVVSTGEDLAIAAATRALLTNA
ncbi:MAG: acetate kinase [Acidimicrobiales bacterium]